jgi:hypothetical protein
MKTALAAASIGLMGLGVFTASITNADPYCLPSPPPI